MTRIRRVALALLCCAILLCSFLSIQTTLTQKQSGSYSSVTPLTTRSYNWFRDTFSGNKSLINLLWAADRFACENFRYTQVETFIVQYFNVDEFLFEKPYEGVCFQFACFCKCAALVWAQEQGRTDIRSYVYSVELPSGEHHAFNIFYEGDTLYYIDLTTDSTLSQRGEKIQGLLKINCSLEEFFQRRGYRVTDVN